MSCVLFVLTLLGAIKDDIRLDQLCRLVHHRPDGLEHVARPGAVCLATSLQTPDAAGMMSVCSRPSSAPSSKWCQMVFGSHTILTAALGVHNAVA